MNQLSRKNYVENIFNLVIEDIRADIGEYSIWVSIDETTDVERRFIPNVIVGALSSKSAKKSYLIHSEEMKKINSQTIAKVLNNALLVLWSGGIKYERVFLFVTDAAPYMIEVGTDLLILYTRLIHVTCIAHALHRVAEFIRGQFKKADSLISCGKKIFLKSPYRVQKFYEMFPNLALPPAPIITRWGTWITAAHYYAVHWNEVKNVIINSLKNHSEAIERAKVLFADDDVLGEFATIFKEYFFLANCITELETAGLCLCESMNILGKVLNKMKMTSNQHIKDKLSAILQKNPGLKILNYILSNDITALKVHKGNQFTNASPADIAAFNYAPIVSCDVERSFSSYKRILLDNHRSFKFENLRYHLIIACNAKNTPNDDSSKNMDIDGDD